ncbi:MAG TPA: D-alanyl-D-alanine carboxypeptidase family protein [Gaiellaceae bacterium]|nr:D-alanyl-D-alanine carboxypeptidase family protein [Gaiellaceae bacterium]
MRRVALLALVAALAAPAAARAAGPHVDADAYLIEDARTGEVLAAHDAHERRPIASITKLMTVIVALHHHALGDVVTVDPRAAEVGEESIYLRAGEQLTVRDLVEAALIQSANDAADALALSVAPDYTSFAALMNREARTLGLRDTHFVRPDGLDAPGEYSTAADVTTLARDAMRVPFVRETVRRETADIAGGRVLHTWDDLLGVLPGVIGVKTGHTNEAGWCQVAAIRGRGVTVYATILGSPDRQQRDDDLERLLVWGLARFRTVPVVQAGRAYAAVALPYGRAPVQLVSPRPALATVRVDRPLVERVVASASAPLPVRAGQVLGRVEVWGGGKLLARRPLVASRTVNRPGLLGRVGWYAGRTFHHVVDWF